MIGPAEVVRRHYDAFNRADFNAWVDRLTPDFTVHHATMGDVVGRDRYLSGVRFYRQSFPDVIVELGRILEADGMAAAEFTGIATVAHDWMGVPATGQRWELPGMGFFRVEDGRLAETWFVEDATKWFHDLSAGPTTPEDQNAQEGSR